MSVSHIKLTDILKESVAPRGYRISVVPTKVAGQGPGQKWYIPRIFFNGQDLHIMIGTAFETKEKAREYGVYLANEDAKNRV